VLPGRKVQVESWFETGDSPKGAKVRVERADGSLLFPEPGELDEKGIYVFPYEKAEKLKVVVSAGAGHRKVITLSAAELANPGAPPPDAPAGEAAREHRYEFPVKELLAGVAFLLALAAFVLSLRNAQQLAELRRLQRQLADRVDTQQSPGAGTRSAPDRKDQVRA
jgi:hypothetical protein